jgi:hypothetical protein
VQRTLEGGTIDWLIHRQPVGVPVPKTVHDVFPNAPLLFARELAPDPSAPERIVVGLLKTQRPSPGVLVGDQVCEAVIGGRYASLGSTSGCWYANQVFSTAPGLSGEQTTTVTTSGHVPFNWIVTNQQGSVQYVTISGLASDTVARLRLYLGTGQEEPVALNHNGYIVEAPSVDYPLRLVAYDHQGQIIGIATFPGQPAPAAHAPTEAAAPHQRWQLVIANNAGEISAVPSTSGGTCYAVQYRKGGGWSACERPLAPDALLLNGGGREFVADTQSGPAITRIVLQYRNGRTKTLSPRDGATLTLIPAGDRPPIAPGKPDSLLTQAIIAITGLDAQGHIVAHQSFLPRLIRGSGTIHKLSLPFDHDRHSHLRDRR